MKTNKGISLVAAALAALGAMSSPRLSAETGRWSVQVARVDAGSTSLPPSFQGAIYENLVERLTKSKRFDQVLREGNPNAVAAANLLVLETTCEKYTAGSEIRRAVTTITGATKLTVRARLVTPDGKVVLERSIHGNVRFIGSNLRATQNLARNIVKSTQKSSLPQPSPVAAKATSTELSDDIVVVEFP